MAEYKIFHSATFDREISKMDTEFRNWLDKIENQLAESPYAGDPLGTKWFREKKHSKYRVYFLIYEHIKSVYMVAVSDKKDQRKVINSIRLLLGFYKKEIENLINST